MAVEPSANRKKLDAALAALVEERKAGGPKVTLAAAHRRAGVSRSTATRDDAFVTLVKRSAAEADEAMKAAAATTAVAAAPTRRERMAYLRQANTDMANLIAVMSIAYQKLEAEVAALRASASGGKVVPINGLRRGARG